MAKQYLRFGEMLLQQGLINQDQLTKAIEQQKRSPGAFIGMVLLKMQAITEKDLANTLSLQLNIPAVSFESGTLTVDKKLAPLISEEFSRKNHLIPLSLGADLLTVAMADPTDIVALDNVRKITGMRVNKVVAPMDDVEAALEKLYGEGGMLRTAVEASYAATEGTAKDERPNEGELSLDNMLASAEKTPVVQLVDLIVRQAIRDRASDIHVEPFQDRITIRFRIDGVLHEIPSPDKSMTLPLISRLKILSRMDIAEKRLPQDGSFRANIENRAVDFRVSTIPTVHGEKMVMRILDKGAVSLDLKTLGFDKQELELYRNIIAKPYGMILITGPTGSGKTTTLYAALNELKGTDKNIITVEDPVEYKIDGINQVQVKPAIGLTFASALRAFLRQDPDIILVGETRDAETAQICIRAALTGHLVFSTLHTNDAPTAINRLIDIGVEPFFVASSLQMVVAQRLVRRLCPKCKQSYKPTAAQLPKNFDMPDSGVLYKPVGCETCSKTGYQGRRAIFELMVINEPLRELISLKAPMNQIRAEARKGGMSTLQESGFKKVRAGETSLEEVLRITLADAA